MKTISVLAHLATPEQAICKACDRLGLKLHQDCHYVVCDDVISLVASSSINTIAALEVNNPKVGFVFTAYNDLASPNSTVNIIAVVEFFFSGLHTSYYILAKSLEINEWLGDWRALIIVDLPRMIDITDALRSFEKWHINVRWTHRVPKVGQADTEECSFAIEIEGPPSQREAACEAMKEVSASTKSFAYGPFPLII